MKKTMAYIIALTMIFTVVPIFPTTMVQAAPENIKVVTNSAGDTREGSLRQVAGVAVSGDIIVFSDAVTDPIVLEATVSFSLSNITVDASLDTDGNPRSDNRMITIDANNVGNAISSTTGGSHTYLTNLIIKNGSFNSQGGGVRINSNGYITNCRFIDNTTTSTGGAVWAKDNLTVYNSYFYGNSAVSGGGIHAQKELYIYNSSFINNWSTSGAATDGGGAVYQTSIYHVATVNCTFAENDSAGISKTGTIYSNSNHNGAVIVPTQSTFVNNGSVAVTLLNSLQQTNSGIYNSILAANNGKTTAGVTADQTNIDTPKGENIIQDGTIHTYNDLFETAPVVTYLVNGTEILGTVATPEQKRAASTAYVIPNKAYRPITEATRMTTRPHSKLPTDFPTGLAVYDQLGNARTNHTKISHGAIDFYRVAKVVNTTEGDGPGSLKAVLENTNDYDVITFDPSVFNSAENNKLTLSSPVTITKSIRIIGNMYDADFDYENKVLTVDGKKGTIIDGGGTSNLLISNISSTGTLIFENLSFENAYGDTGSVINTKEGNISFINCIFNKNTATGDGGAVSASGALTADSYINFYDSVFSWNTAVNGGVINVNVTDFQCHVSMLDCYATQNKATATGSGSVISSLGGLIRAVNTTMYENICEGTTATPATIITLDNKDALLYLYHCSLVRNTAGVYTVRANINALYLYNIIFVENGNNKTGGTGGHTRYVPKDGYHLYQPENDLDFYAKVYGAGTVPNDTKLIPLSDGLANTVGAYSVNISRVAVLPTWLPTLAEAVQYDQRGKMRATDKYVTYGAIDVDYTSGTKRVTTNELTGVGSLPYVVENALPYDTIVFDTDVDEIVLTSEITFKKALYFIGNKNTDGSPATILNANQTGRIFSIEDNNPSTTIYSDTTFANIAFINGQKTGKSDRGGAVYAFNSATSNGGPLRALQFNNCLFKDNKLTGAESHGGAVYSWNTIRFVDCVFEGNSAAGGGAIGCGDRGDTVPINCIFKNNKATGDTTYGIGSAITSVRRVIAVNSTFTGNVNELATARGGVIGNGNNGSAPIMLFHCTIVGNNPTELTGNTSAPVLVQNTAKITMYNNLILNNGGNTSATEGTLDTTSGQNNLTYARTDGYLDVFGTNGLTPDGYIMPLPIDTNQTTALTAKPAVCPLTDIIDLLKLDQLNMRRSTESPLYGAVDGTGLAFKNSSGNYISLLSSVLDDNKLLVNKYIRNVSGGTQTYTLIAALYSPDKELMSIKTLTSDEIASDALISLNTELDVSEKVSDSFVIVYLWDGLSTVKPLDESIIFQ